MMMSLIENNLDAQKEGIVRLFYNLDTPAKMTEHNEVIQKGSTLARSLPIRFVGIHFCYNSEYMIPMLSAVQLAVGVEGRSRLRDHYGEFPAPSSWSSTMGAFFSPNTHCCLMIMM